MTLTTVPCRMTTSLLTIVSAISLLAGCTRATDKHFQSSLNDQAQCPKTYSNPILWEDLPDVEVIRVGDTYYYTASTFHHSPGAPLLRSYDLVHWEYLSQSVPVLDSHPRYDLKDENAYVKGIWASTLQYRESNETFYWMGCMHDIGGGWAFTAKNPKGPWQKHPTEGCYYDMGLLIEEDTDKMYVAYGHGTLSVAELSADGLSEVRNEVVYETPKDLTGPLEGTRFYKINGDYYMFVTQYANGEYVLRSTNGPFGPYELKPFAVALPFKGKGAGGQPHQGGIVQTQKGDWYYMAFNDAFPGGRIPVMAPVTWHDGWPEVQLEDGAWAASYPFPDLPCGADKVTPPGGMDTFSTPTLGPQWEWNHNPDNTKWHLDNGLTLEAATVTDDLYNARNTLTQRIAGPASTGTTLMLIDQMQEGDVAGLAAFRDRSAWIGVKRENGKNRIVVAQNMALNNQWLTESLGEEVASRTFEGDKVWLRIDANIRTEPENGYANFYYSLDGKTFQPLGATFKMKRDWPYFLGYRFALFNYATQSLGGKVVFPWFERAVNHSQ